MNNFLGFIEEDINNKKTLFSSLPVNTKPNIRKFNEKIKVVEAKYNEYKEQVKKYLDTKSDSFNVTSNRNNEDIISGIKHMEQVRFILNTHNTYFEKMGFDSLIYAISNYHDFKFATLIETLNEFVKKFESIGIKLSGQDFNYTCYVNEFMTYFLDNSSNENPDLIAGVFEKIYWVNPEIVEHIELNFRKLIKKYEKEFILNIKKMQNEVQASSKLNYEETLNNASKELSVLEKENITDIIESAKSKKIDINHYFEDSKIRISTFSGLMIEPLNTKDNFVMSKFYEELLKLKNNLVEYDAYLKFIPLINDFKNTYLKGIDKAEVIKNLKKIETDIEKNEEQLDKLNKKLFGNNGELSENLKAIKFESVKLANTLYDLYKTYDEENFKSIIVTELPNILTVADLFGLYYYFDYFKKLTIKKVFNLNNYEEIVDLSNAFDKIAVNPLNVIVNGISLSEESDIAKVIVNKYRIVNINIGEEDLSAGNTSTLLEKIDFILRTDTIEKSSVSVEKIWFIAEVAKINGEK